MKDLNPTFPNSIENQVGFVDTLADPAGAITFDEGKTFGSVYDLLGTVDEFIDKGHGPTWIVTSDVIANRLEVSLSRL